MSGWSLAALAAHVLFLRLEGPLRECWHAAPSVETCAAFWAVALTGTLALALARLSPTVGIGAGVLATGSVANAAATILNGGHMPVFGLQGEPREVWIAAGATTRVPWLVDQFGPRQFSVGDVLLWLGSPLIGLGVALWLWRTALICFPHSDCEVRTMVAVLKSSCSSPVLVPVPAGHHGGSRLSAIAPPAPSLLSARVRALGLETRADVEREFAAAKQGWSQGTLYICPFCDKDFYSPSGARKHMKTQDHPVLRWDWY